MFVGKTLSRVCLHVSLFFFLSKKKYVSSIKNKNLQRTFSHQLIYKMKVNICH